MERTIPEAEVSRQCDRDGPGCGSLLQPSPTLPYFWRGPNTPPTMNNILCPTDLSETSSKGIAFAELLAARLGGSVSLLHVADKQELKDGDAVQAELEGQRAQVTKAPATASLHEGEFMEEIAEAGSTGHVLMVCATHGPRGLKQSLFGAQILKLVRKVQIPSLVVQKNSPLNNGFGIIVMPVAGHADISQLLDGVCLLAKAFGSTVHIYQQDRAGETPSRELLDNKARMQARLAAEGIPCELVEEPSRSFSVGFAGATIAYAERVGAGCIAIMSVASEEYRYIADAEKERLLANEPGIPVLCAQ